jgi:hypothetical protein
MMEPPPYWTTFCTAFLRTTPQLSRQLWRTYVAAYPSTAHTVLWQLDLCAQYPTPERQMAFANLIPPKMLLEVAERLCAAKCRRNKEVIALEECILHYTNASGGWRW